MADIEKKSANSGAHELANITSGVPKDFPISVSTRKEIIEEMITSTHKELTRLEIEEEYFRHAKGSGIKLAGVESERKIREEQMGKLLQIAVAKSREKRDYLRWLCEQWESLH